MTDVHGHHSKQRSCAVILALAACVVLSPIDGALAQRDFGDAVTAPFGPPNGPPIGRPIDPAATCEILLPPGASEATFQATPWSASLVPLGPIVLGVVPYEFDANVSALNQARVLASMQEIMGVCDVQFVVRDPGAHPNWLHIQAHPSANNSFLGMLGGQQIVNITSWASNQPNVNFVIVHELLHALGFWHEHQRIDRDDVLGNPVFVDINTPCITPAALPNFSVAPVAQLIGPYDFGSVMHYPQWAFSVSWPGCPTIIVQPPFQAWQALIGQRLQLSQTDIAGLCVMYGCVPANNTCAAAVTVTGGTTITDTRGATTTAGGCGGLLNDTWYVFDASCTGQVSITLNAPSAGYTPALAVYDDPCGSGAVVACDTSAPLQASFPVNQGERYFIRVGGVGVPTGTARLQIACAAINCVTGLQWAQAATTGPGPRRNHAMVYDSVRQRVILFGGVEGITDLGDTWEWDPAAQSWTLRTTTGPAPRMHHAMAYDSARQRVVLFGGFPSFGDTWEYDPVANSWQLRSSTGPLPRYAHEMAYDAARQRVVLFGGAGAGFTGDTWEWDGAAGTWTLPPVVGTVPPVRQDFGMAHDVNRAVTVMWGGHATDTSTWEWDGTQWTEYPGGLAPSAREGHHLVFDPGFGRMLMFGGWVSGPVFHDDLWSWDGAAWSDHGNATAPAGRAWHASAFDASTGVLLVHGGSDGLLLSDTWRALVSGVPSDDAAGAALVTNGTISIDNRCAADGSTGCGSERDIWFR